MLHDISEIGNPDAWEEFDISEELEKEQVAYEKAHKDQISISIVPELTNKEESD